MVERIPHHQLQPGDVLRWQCPTYQDNVHRWRVRGVHLGGLGEESLVEMEVISHSHGWTQEEGPHRVVFVPEVLVRSLEIEDVGDQFGVPSSRRGAA